MATAGGRRARAVRAVTAVALVTMLLTGCVTQSGGVTGDLARAADAAASAASTGHLTLETYLAGRSTPSATDTTLATMIDEAQDAEVAVATAAVASEVQSEQQTLALTTIREATDALVAARTWASDDVGDPAEILLRLDEAAGALALLATTLEAAT